MTEQCDGRYPVPQTSPPREEAEQMTYRCGKVADHSGEHGPLDALAPSKQQADPFSIPGGELCTVCGLRYYSQSMGGPGICPSCDCGNFGKPVVDAQRKEIERLRVALERYAAIPNYGAIARQALAVDPENHGV